MSVRGLLSGQSRPRRPSLVKAGEKLSHIAGTVIVSLTGGFADTLATNASPPAPTLPPTGSTLVGYARCSANKEDLAAQKAALQPRELISVGNGNRAPSVDARSRQLI